MTNSISFPHVDRFSPNGLPRQAVERKTGTFQHFIIPLWQPAAIFGGISVFLMWPLIRASHRIKRGCCPNCNYDRRGLDVISPCPECNTSPSP